VKAASRYEAGRVPSPFYGVKKMPAGKARQKGGFTTRGKKNLRLMKGGKAFYFFYGRLPSTPSTRRAAAGARERGKDFP